MIVRIYRLRWSIVRENSQPNALKSGGSSATDSIIPFSEAGNFLMKFLVAFFLFLGIPSARDESWPAIRLTCGELIVIAAPPSSPTISHVEAMAQCLGAPPECTIETIRIRN